MISREIQSFHDQIIKAGQEAVEQLLGNDTFFEINDIKFTFDYNDKTDKDELILLYINCNFGKTDIEKEQYNKEFVIYTCEHYNIDSLDFMYGVMFGLISRYA